MYKRAKEECLSGSIGLTLTTDRVNNMNQKYLIVLFSVLFDGFGGLNGFDGFDRFDDSIDLMDSV